jgi:hypothetical protein
LLKIKKPPLSQAVFLEFMRIGRNYFLF